MRLILTLLFCAACLFAVSCQTLGLPGPVAGNAPLTADLELTLERTACYGTCPVYKVSVRADNKVTFEGIRHTGVEGKAEDVLTKEKREQLIDAINKSGFFSLSDSYENDKDCPSYATDQSKAILTIKLDGKEKTIKHYLGCVESGGSFKVFPAQLFELEKKIDEVLGTHRWTVKDK